MSTVTSHPAFGSVEYFAQQIRDAARFMKDDGDVFVYVTGMISGVVGSVRLVTDAEKVRGVRNALAAGELVRAEMQAAR